MSKLTNIYIPNSNDLFRFTNNSDSDDADNIINSNDFGNEITSFTLFEGIANGNTENDKYKQLLEDYDLSSIGINDLIKVTFKENRCDKTNKPPNPLKDIISLEDCKFIFDVKSKNLTLNEAWFVYNKTLFQGRKLISLFNKAIIRQKKENVHWSKKSTILSDEHHEFLKDLLIKPQNSLLTLDKIKREIISKFENIPDFSLETLRLELRNKTRANYKVVSKINCKFSRASNIISFGRMSKLVESLVKQNVELIFFDEFSINSRSSKMYGWGIRGQKACIMHQESTQRF